jgi:hypothetical protein
MKAKFAILIVAALLVVPVANAQDSATQQGAAEEPYEPDIGDIMALQQMRHIKLWFAGHAGNWPLADYEIDKLKGGFDDVNKQMGGDIVEKAVGAPIAAIGKAIEAKDREAFARAFDQLTAGCNSCHRTLDHAFLVIQRPNLLPYSNQSFAPQK